MQNFSKMKNIHPAMMLCFIVLMRIGDSKSELNRILV